MVEAPATEGTYCIANVLSRPAGSPVLQVLALMTGDASAGAPGRYLSMTVGHELVHVALVVGEQDEPLHIPRRGAGVVPQPRERVVDPFGREQRQGARRVVLSTGKLAVLLEEALAKAPDPGIALVRLEQLYPLDAAVLAAAAKGAG